jgi:hypothetical protein
MWQKT